MGKLSDYNKRKNKQTASQSPFAVNGLMGGTGTYARDKTLFRELGLKTFSNISGDYYVGEVLFPGGSKIKIWVCAAPAQFWKFEIYDKESKRTTIASTGSGGLVDFWPTVKLMAENMFVIDSIA
jgi:hypothetical protein